MRAILAVLLVLLLTGCTTVIPPTIDPPPITENRSPVAYAPFVVGSGVGNLQPLTIDLRYRVHGCIPATGAPESVTGALDPDGDPLEYRFSCMWSVFDFDGNRINGEWVTFPTEITSTGRTEQAALVKVWIGWDADYPLMPMGGCMPTPQPVTFTYEVRDDKGWMASHTVVIGSSL